MKRHGLSVPANNTLAPSCLCFLIIFRRRADGIIVSQSEAPSCSGSAKGFYTNIFPPWLITLRLRGSKPVMNNIWMSSISSTQGPSINTTPRARCPRLVRVTWGGHIRWTFPSEVSPGEQQKAPRLKVEVGADYPQRPHGSLSYYSSVFVSERSSAALFHWESDSVSQRKIPLTSKHATATQRLFSIPFTKQPTFGKESENTLLKSWSFRRFNF